MPYQSPAVVLGFAALALFSPSGPFDNNDDLPSHLREDARAMIHIKLERLLLERFLVPLDEWIRLGTPQAMFVHTQVKEAWFAIVIDAAEPDLGRRLALRFRLDSERKQIKQSYTVQDEELFYDSTESHSEYMWRRRGEILRALEKYAVDEMGNAEAAVTLRTGEAKLYRLATPDTDLTTLRKEDLIF